MEKFQITYLILAIFIWFAGYFHTGRFVRPKWKIPGKFFFYIAVSAGLLFWVKDYALIFIIGHPLIGLAFHTWICIKYDINWFTCKPEEKYLQLTEKWVKGE